jgi:outer membrane protein
VLDCAAGYQRLDLANQLVTQATSALDLAETRYNLGLSSIVELTQAQLHKDPCGHRGRASARVRIYQGLPPHALSVSESGI